MWYIGPALLHTVSVRALIFYLTLLELSNRERGCHLQATAAPLQSGYVFKKEYTYWNFFVL